METRNLKLQECVEIRLKMADPNLIVGALPGGVSLSRYIRNRA